MARDSLRATLDNLQVDPDSAQERPYLEAMLLRLGYTEKEIREELGPVVESDAPAVVKDAVPVGDLLAPSREYRLVIPARESSFALDNAYAPPGTDSPFEDFERVEFAETAPDEDTVDFEEIPAPIEESREPAVTELEPLPEVEFIAEAPLQEFQEAPVEALKADETGAGMDNVAIDTFGGPDVSTQPKTRVRMKRVRAKSMAEAEAKVAKGGRKVIKSIPVDIVERWGDRPSDKAEPGKGARK